LPLPIGRQDPEGGYLHHCRYPQGVPAGAGPGRFGGDNPLLEKRLLRPHRGRSVPQWPIRQSGDGAKRPSLRLSQVSKRLRSWLLPGCRGPGQTSPPWGVGCKWGDRTSLVLAPWAQQSHVIKARPAPGFGIPGPVHVPVAPVANAAGHRQTCKEIGDFAKPQQLLRQGHTYLDRNGHGIVCESLR